MSKPIRLMVVVTALFIAASGFAYVQRSQPAEGLAPYYRATAREGSIFRLYRAYFLRDPDQGGFDYWYRASVGGRTLTQISATFAGSSEFKNRYGTLGNAGFIDLVYRNVLDRAPDAGGRTYWLNRLNGGTSRGGVMLQFSDSSEYRRITTLGLAPGFRAGSNARAMLAELTVAAEPTRVGYDRDLFKHWDDENSNGCDTRCEVLRSERRSNNSYFSLWDGYSTPDVTELEIDHVVALAEAWDSGANSWSASQRDRFADWQVNLTAVSSASNQSKSDRDAGEWFPSRAASNCAFAEITVTTKYRWNLSVDTAEKSALTNMLTNCTATTSNPPSVPTTTTTTRPTGCATSNIYRARNGACVANYRDATGDVDCGQLPAAMKPVTVLNPANDPDRLDNDADGVGCESG